MVLFQLPQLLMPVVSMLLLLPLLLALLMQAAARGVGLRLEAHAAAENRDRQKERTELENRLQRDRMVAKKQEAAHQAELGRLERLQAEEAQREQGRGRERERERAALVRLGAEQAAAARAEQAEREEICRRQAQLAAEQVEAARVERAGMEMAARAEAERAEAERAEQQAVAGRGQQADMQAVLETPKQAEAAEGARATASESVAPKPAAVFATAVGRVVTDAVIRARLRQASGRARCRCCQYSAPTRSDPLQIILIRPLSRQIRPGGLFATPSTRLH